MLHFFYDAVREFLFDDQAFKRIMRPILITFGLSGVAFADQISSFINSPGAVRWIKLAALVCGFIGGAIKMGEKNMTPEELHAAVTQVQQGKTGTNG